MAGSNNNKKVTIFDVAAEAGVSYSTVSRVINDDPRIKQKTKEKVRQVIGQLGYVANYHARKLAGIRSTVIGVMVPDFGGGNSYLSEILQGIDAELQLTGYDMVLYTAHRQEVKETSYIGQVTGGLANGVLLVLARFVDSYIESLTRRKFPFVLIDQQERNSNYPSIGAANWQGMYQATEYLIRLGHRRIGLIKGWNDMESARERLAGYRDALKAHHLPDDPSLVIEGSFAQPDGYRGANLLLDLAAPPTAILASNDMMAFGALDAVRLRGKRVPEDISIVGFDDIPQAAYSHPALTTVRQPLQQMGRLATQMLIDMIRDESFAGRKIDLPTELVIRDSCAPPAPSL